MKIAYIFIPFAYNGPCVTESGPKAMQFEINKKYGKKEKNKLEKKKNETKKEYII